MKKLIAILLFIPFCANAQVFKAVITDAETKALIPKASASIKNLKLSFIANDSGEIFIDKMPAGKQTIEISAVGYKEIKKIFIFPLADTGFVQIYLEPEAKDLEDVTVISTRSNRSISNTPSRVEVIAEDEIHEEANMRPGDIRMLLAESTGIQTQQTSATTANSGIRIQGLDGRYTQILKDGFPVFSGAASGLGLLQTAPLDLRQVEIIKGSSSTLYGGGAIAGIVNLLTKLPKENKELNFLVNATSAGGLDINSFYGKRFKKTGVTLFASRNSNQAYDPAAISFSAIPEFERYTLNPKIFLFFNDKTKLNFGINSSVENRLGGDIFFIKGKGDSTHSFFERNKTQRISTQFTFDHRLSETNSFKLKNSVSYFNRIISSSGYTFSGTQYSSFTEVTFADNFKKNDWVAGLNVLTDKFKEDAATGTAIRDYFQTTLGAFVQNTYNARNWLTLETGLRADFVNNYGYAILPRISALFKISPKLTSRIGAGFGYKPPTIFTEETEKLLYKNILPVSAGINKSERSYGANGDVNFKTSFDKVTFSINQFFFYTFLKKPLFLQPVYNNFYRLQNIAGDINTRGAETNIKLAYDKLALYIGYTFTDARVNNAGIKSIVPLTPKHRFNAALVYEIEDKWKFGSELYYFSKQQRSDGSTGNSYWLTGLVAEKLWKQFSLFINFENFGDVRQTKFENIYTGSVTNPAFKDIYAPLEGFVVNGGIKINL